LSQTDLTQNPWLEDFECDRGITTSLTTVGDVKGLGFVFFPKNFDEFHERFPQYVRNKCNARPRGKLSWQMRFAAFLKWPAQPEAPHASYRGKRRQAIGGIVSVMAYNVFSD
jgi:hypothetical protein